MNFGRRTQKTKNIDLVPMVDVVFLILLFFVISSVLNIQRTIDIRLPEASTGKKEPFNSPPVIVVNKNGEIVFNGKQVEVKALNKMLKDFNSQKKGQVLIIQADGNVKHQLIVFVMDVARKNGFTKLSIATVPNRR